MGVVVLVRIVLVNFILVGNVSVSIDVSIIGVVIAMAIGMIASLGLRRHERRQARSGQGERPLKQGTTGERLLSLFPRLFARRFHGRQFSVMTLISNLLRSHSTGPS